VHVAIWHSVVGAMQSLATLHATQSPIPSHTTPPLSVQAVPALTSVTVHALLVHAGTVQRVVPGLQSVAALHSTHPADTLQTGSVVAHSSGAPGTHM
jgi:hypothetical protein